MTHFKTTIPGYKNLHGQEVVERTGFPSASKADQTIYRMRCIHCGYRYGSNGCDIKSRRCPSHQGGTRGEVIPIPPQTNLFQS
jgi:hypothetical protein